MAIVKKLTKIGNSWGVIIPGEVMKAAHLKGNSKVKVDIENDRVVISPIDLKDERIMRTFMKVIQDYDNTFSKLAK